LEHEKTDQLTVDSDKNESHTAIRRAIFTNTLKPLNAVSFHFAPRQSGQQTPQPEGLCRSARIKLPWNLTWRKYLTE